MSREGETKYGVPIPPRTESILEKWQEFLDRYRPVGTSAYAVPEMISMYAVYPYEPEAPAPPLWPPVWPTPPLAFNPGLSDEDRALLKRIEEKLDELLNRTAPEADVIAEIRKRVDAVIAGFGKKTP